MVSRHRLNDELFKSSTSRIGLLKEGSFLFWFSEVEKGQTQNEVGVEETAMQGPYGFSHL